MVKGVSKQVIVVHSPGEELFEQAIFILNDDAVGKGVTDDELLKQARQAIHSGSGKKRKLWHYGPVWAGAGAALTAILWIITAIL